MSHEHLSTQTPFSFDTEGRAADFAGRVRQLEAFTQRELGAYGLFKRVALRTIAHGDELERVTTPPTRPGRGLTALLFPAINYDPNPGDSSLRRQILLRLDHVVEKNEIVSATPWLTVHPMEIAEDESLTETAEEVFVRLPLEALVGRRDADEAKCFFDTMLSPDRMEARHVLLEEQDAYIGWLGRAAVSVGVPPKFYTMPDNTTFDSFEFN